MFRFVRAASMLSVVMGCAPDEPQANPDPAATELWERMQGYEAWTRAPGFAEPVRGTGPHGRYAEIYLGPELDAAVAAGQPLEAWPPGSAVVAEGWADPEATDLVAISVMDNSDGAWTFLQFGTDGEAVAFGQPSGCIGCHEAGDDYLRSVALPVAP